MFLNSINYTIFLVKNHSIRASLLKSTFTNKHRLSNINDVVAKSITEPENSNIITTANNSTPLKRAFFVCGLHTPKEKINNLILSMVAWSGKGLALCYNPLFIVSQTVSRYRQTLRSKAVTFNYLYSYNGAKK